ncbi:MAG: acyl--CoA ligase, partial [Spirochaetales bacterium]|nr:acyl--CoA ligase [Spirochaetales bacterium]
MIEKKTVLDRYRGEFFDGEWPSITEMLKLNAHRYSDRPAFSHFEGNEKHSITFGELLERVYGVATFLKSKGVKKGDRIILNGKNTPAWGISYLGIQALSAVVVPLDNQMAADRVDALSEFSGARAIFADSDVLDKSTAEFEFKVSLSKFDNSEYIDFESIKAAKKAPGALPTEDDVAAILFTSGTTGNEKGVVLTHANFMSNVFQASDPNFLNFTHEDVLYGLLPLHHSY